MNLEEVLAAYERARAAYVMDAEAARGAFEALGQTWVGQYREGSVQAVLTMREGAGFLSISGTRFSDGQVEDLLKDLEVEGKDVGGGAKVASGPFEGLFGLWKWVFANLPATAPVWVEGHSLGGWRTYYSPLFCPESRLAGLHVFESPKAANAAYWAAYGREDTVSVVHQGDIFFGYPFVTDWGASHPPRDHLWLHAGQLSVIRPEEWPGGLSVEDHSADAGVAALRALVQPA